MRGGNLRCSIANLTRSVGTRLVVHLIVILQELLLVYVLVATLVLEERSGLREERAIVVALAKVLSKTSELTDVEASTVASLLVVLLVVTVELLSALLLLLVVTAAIVVVQEAWAMLPIWLKSKPDIFKYEFASS